MPNVRGKSLKAVVRDVAAGYVMVNPIFLKSFDDGTLRTFYGEMSKVQIEIRSEKFPTHDIAAIRNRNLRLQRLYSAIMITRNYARERKIVLT
ncbi:MAG: hypothetical protein P8013_09220 [Candidatus Sulfobium sp.]|jgi:hypothetical protein